MLKSRRTAFLSSLMKQSLSKERYRHVKEVAQLATKLARLHGWDPKSAYQTGLVHDCAKEWSSLKLSQYVRHHRVAVPGRKFIETHCPNMLHAYAGAHWAKANGWIQNSASLKAIASHTLGDLKMSKPQMIIYIADFSSKDRRYKSAMRVRRLAKKNLKSACLMAMAKKIEWNLLSREPLHPLTWSIWNHLLHS